MRARLAVESLCRSALWEALALGLRPPTRETVRRLVSPRGAAGLVLAAERLDREGLVGLVGGLADTDTRSGALTAAYQRLFGHVARGEVSLFETEYGADALFVQPQELADLAGFYAAFGLVPAPAGRERPDHVSCECEFLMFLARKQAIAHARGDASTVAETRKATRLFLRDHLGRFVPALAARLARADPAGFYGALAALAGAWVARECRAVDVPLGAATLPLRESVDDGVPAACDGCPRGVPGDEVHGG
jgi:DMSO reductase family type II enzyme chaperone